jgi:hypothetical protein
MGLRRVEMSEIDEKVSILRRGPQVPCTAPARAEVGERTLLPAERRNQHLRSTNAIFEACRESSDIST